MTEQEIRRDDGSRPRGIREVYRHVILAMLKNGQTARMSDFVDGRGDVIIRISSTPAISGHTEVFPVSLANFAVIAMTKHIAWEFIESNIRAYVLALRKSAEGASYNSMSGEERAKAANEPSMKREENRKK